MLDLGQKSEGSAAQDGTSRPDQMKTPTHGIPESRPITDVAIRVSKGPP